jgi:phospholipid transport system substrate-binding protein
VVIVRTRIVTAKDEYHVDYEMREREGRWLATDVIIEGISLTDNYRSQFASLLRDRSFPELLDLMRRKTRPVREEPM